jgi:membrane protein DedA with SNARE-associated domain
LAHKWGNLIVRKFGKFLFLEESHIDRAEKLFKKYGVWTIIFGRHIPGMRVPITIFAAISGMRYRVFIASTFVSAVPWAAFYLTVGKSYGKRIQHILHPSVLQSVLIIVAIILGVLAIHLVGKYRERHKKASLRHRGK